MLPVTSILSRWLARHYLVWLFIFFAIITGLAWLFEFSELLRRASEKPEATISIIIKMATFKLPETIDRVTPFVVLFAAMFCFSSLNKSQELVVARASGISAWQFLMPALMVTVIIAVLNITLFNPLSSILMARYAELETKYLIRTTSLNLTGAGLWLRQDTDEQRLLIHADRVATDPLKLMPIFAIIYDQYGRYTGRIDAPEAVLRDGAWVMEKAWRNDDEQPRKEIFDLHIPTNLTTDTIQESMTRPDGVSFWQLPDFIGNLRKIGLPTRRHELEWHGLLANPLLLAAMTIFAAVFSLRNIRNGRNLITGISGILCGVTVFTLSNVMLALGANQTLPVVVAAWATPILSGVTGVMALLYFEDG